MVETDYGGDGRRGEVSYDVARILDMARAQWKPALIGKMELSRMHSCGR